MPIHDLDEVLDYPYEPGLECPILKMVQNRPGCFWTNDLCICGRRGDLKSLCQRGEND
ncbi:MAG: hypothetical protein SWO11_08455 [Thermodesulfobacteriota bacterium]|nr:hypothetical protein [Thermodesulfobacteriota bacterium]